MKHCILFLFLLPFISKAQTSSASSNDTSKIFSVVEKMPSFKGGENMMMKFIQKSLVYPQAEKESAKNGICYSTFTVEKDGLLTGIKILKIIPGNEAFEAETLRMINSMPKWNPGIQDGKLVRVQYNLPIRFTIR